MTGPMGHDRCYRNRITDRFYIDSATGGSDFVSLDTSGGTPQSEFPNPWVRSTCGIGFLPCNGLLYAGPPACSCSNGVMLNALNALAPEPGLKSSGQPIEVATVPRLEKGPAYADISDREVSNCRFCRLAHLSPRCRTHRTYHRRGAGRTATAVDGQTLRFHRQPSRRRSRGCPNQRAGHRGGQGLCRRRRRPRRLGVGRRHGPRGVALYRRRAHRFAADLLPGTAALRLARRLGLLPARSRRRPGLAFQRPARRPLDHGL